MSVKEPFGVTVHSTAFRRSSDDVAIDTVDPFNPEPGTAASSGGLTARLAAPPSPLAPG
jgi:hypothetical protein